MPDTFEVTVTGIDQLVAELERLVVGVAEGAPGIVSKGALNIKRDWRAAWSGHPHITGLAAAVSYDTTRRKTNVEAEIGPDKNRPQGALGNIIEFGDDEGNAPIPAGLPALDAEDPKFYAAAQALVAKLLP